MSVKIAAFGILKGTGAIAHSFTLRNARGMEVVLTNYGATVLSVKTPSKLSTTAEEITYCSKTLDELQSGTAFFGATIGRVANRIAEGRFSVDGKEYTVATNNGPNHLHGGVVGFDKVLWSPQAWAMDGRAGVDFSLVSHDGSEGYPGTLTATARYELTPACELTMEFAATTDKATPVNICNHTYWNLSGNCKEKVYDHVLTLHAPFYLPEKGQIPIGDVAPVAGTPFDFSNSRRVGEVLHNVDGGGQPGYDHCWARAGAGAVPSNGLGFAPLAVLHEPHSGRTMTISTDAPGVQFYTGNFLPDQHRALCLETQNYPNAINEPKFPNSVLRPGERYFTKTVHKFEW